MGFNLVEKGLGRRDEVVNRVACSSNGSQIVISFSLDVLARLGNPEKVTVYMGDGADTGTVYIAPAVTDRNAYNVAPTGGSQKKIALSNTRVGLLRNKVRISAVEFTIEDKGVVLSLPSDLYVQPASEQRKITLNDRPRVAA